MVRSTKQILTTDWSDNPFADLGFREPDLEMAKATFVMEMASVINERGMSSAKAAKVIGFTHRKLSRLLSGHWTDDSLERLAQCLVKLGVTVHFSLKRDSKTWATGKLVVSRGR